MMLGESEDKILKRRRRIKRVRKKVFGTAERPRLCVFRSHKHMYAQIIDDERGITLLSLSTLSKNIPLNGAKTWSVKAAKIVGYELARRSLEKGVKKVVFDRRWYKYHGRVKALAEGAREGGLEF